MKTTPYEDMIHNGKLIVSTGIEMPKPLGLRSGTLVNSPQETLNFLGITSKLGDIRQRNKCEPL